MIRYSSYRSFRFRSPPISRSRHNSRCWYRYHNREVLSNWTPSRSTHTKVYKQRRNCRSLHYSSFRKNSYRSLSRFKSGNQQCFWNHKSSYWPSPWPPSKLASASGRIVRTLQSFPAENHSHYTENVSKWNHKFELNMYTTDITNAIAPTNWF